MTLATELLSGSRRVLTRNGPIAFIYSAAHFVNGQRQLRRATRVGALRLRGRAVVTNDGELIFGDRLRLNGDVVPLQFSCGRGAHLSIGDGTFVNYGADISAVQEVRIGRNCNLGQYAIIIDSDYHNPEGSSLPARCGPVIIEDDVWLGARVTVLRGVRIGRGAVIAAHAVVTSDIPPRVLAGGVPARVIRPLPGAVDG